MDKVIGWDFNKSDGKNCDNCGMKKDPGNDCCKEDSKQIKLDTDQKVTENPAYSFHHDVQVIHLPYAEFVAAPLISGYHQSPYGNAPPLSVTTDLYLVNRVIRI